MAATARTWFAPKQNAEFWERWRDGQCVADIAPLNKKGRQLRPPYFLGLVHRSCAVPVHAEPS